MRRIALMTIVAFGSLIMASSAGAKGLPTRVVIEGPGGRIVLHEDNFDSYILMKASGFPRQVSCERCERLQDEPPPGALGAAYRVIYTTSFRHQRIAQVIYPFATPNPVSYTPPGQPYLFDLRTTGGWFIGEPSLAREMLRLGVPEPSQPARPASPADDRATPPLAWSVVAVLLLLGGLAWLRRRPRVAPRDPAVSG